MESALSRMAESGADPQAVADAARNGERGPYGLRQAALDAVERQTGTVKRDPKHESR